MSASRRPRSVYDVGAEPDPRFSMANERTALAWVRTALALVAAGVGLTSLAEIADLPRSLDAVAAAACLGGGALALRAVLAWRAAERALRLGRPLPAPRALTWLAGLVGIVSVLLAGYAVGRVSR